MQSRARDIIIFVGLAGIARLPEAAILLVLILCVASILHTTYTNIISCLLFSLASFILELAFDAGSPNPGQVADKKEFIDYYAWHTVAYVIVMLAVFCLSWSDGARSYITDRVIVVSLLCVCVNWFEFAFARYTGKDFYMVSINLLYVLTLYFMYKRMEGERFCLLHKRRSTDRSGYYRAAHNIRVQENTARRRKGER